MKHLIEVAFKGNRKEFFVWEGEEPPPIASAVIVEADRGEDFGRVHSIGEKATLRCSGCTHGLGTEEPRSRILRRASSEDERHAREVRAQDDDARRRAMDRVRSHGLVMKLTDAEWQWDRRKLTFYFTAEKRVDFRSLVRDLASTFRTRIELAQIGVRDEAKRLSGIGRCGREYCSASWLPELRPVNLQVAKDQRLSLNPSQISGACGRLMCCLRYEHDFYVQSRKRFPKEGKTIFTQRGEERVIFNDIFRDRVTLRAGDGETRVVALNDLKQELAGAAHAVEVHEDEPEHSVLLEERDEIPLDEDLLLRPQHTAESPEMMPADAVADSVPPPERQTAALSPDHARRRRGRRGGRRNRAPNDTPRQPPPNSE